MIRRQISLLFVMLVLVKSIAYLLQVYTHNDLQE